MTKLLRSGFMGMLGLLAGADLGAGEVGFAETAEAIAAELTKPMPQKTRAFAPQESKIRALKWVGHGAAATVWVAATRPEEPAVNLAVAFAFNSARLTPIGRTQLNELIAALRLPAVQNTTVALRGHTDSIGNEDYNLRLSLQRAEAVRAYLVEVGGLPPQRLLVYGLGEGDPVADNGTEHGRERNRRVEIVAVDRPS